VYVYIAYTVRHIGSKLLVWPVAATCEEAFDCQFTNSLSHKLAE